MNIADKVMALVFNHANDRRWEDGSEEANYNREKEYVQQLIKLGHEDNQNLTFTEKVEIDPDNLEENINEIFDDEDEGAALFPILMKAERKKFPRMGEFHGFFIYIDYDMYEVPLGAVYEMRIKDDDGYVSDWKAILGKFIVICHGDGIDTDWLTMDDSTRISEFNRYFQIRYSGVLTISEHRQRTILSDLTGQRINCSIEPITQRVLFSSEGSLGQSFDERCAEWKLFEERYFGLDAEGMRIKE